SATVSFIRARQGRCKMRTTEQALRQQKQDTERDRQSPPAKVPVATTATAVAPADDRAVRNRYLEDIAGGMRGRLIKFSGKVSKFVTVDDGSDIEDVDYVALCPETLIGWIKFSSGDDSPPERVMGLLYDGFKMPPREELGDLDETQWPAGLNNAPQD